MSGMIFYSFFVFLTVVVAYSIKGVKQSTSYGKDYGNNQGLVSTICFCGLFLLLFLLSSMRHMTGHDYSTYIDRAHDIAHESYGVTEWGFNLLVLLVYSICNCENYILLFAIIAAAMIGFFLAGIYRQSRDFAFSFFLYMAFGLYFQSFSTIRYYLAMSIVFFSLSFWKKKHYIKGILFVIAASFFHKSALFVIPIYFLAGIKWKRIHIIILTLFASTGVIFNDFYLKIMLKLYPSYVVSGEFEGTGGFSIINVLRSLAVVILGLYFWRETVKENNKFGQENGFYFYLNYASLLYFTFFSFVPYGSRIGYYMSISQILYLPSIIEDIKDDKKKKFVKIAVIAAAVLYLGIYLIKADNPGVAVLPYKSWLFENVTFFKDV